MSVNVALVGLGYWGPNLARNLVGLNGAALHTLCDAAPARLQQFARQYPGARATGDYESVLADSSVHAVVIATPVNTHFELALAALRAGKHVLVEKPLAQTSGECGQLIAAAREGRLTLMAGHVFLYNAAVRKVKEYIDSGQIGKVYYVYSQRLNLGIVRKDVNALWNFAPHDFSILNYWLGSAPTAATSRGFSYIQPGIEDVVFLTLDYPEGVGANIHISWLDPHKVRSMTVVGSERMVVYDDVSADARVVLYDKGVTRKVLESKAGEEASLGRFETFGEFQLLTRAGDVLIPKIDFTEPLRLECQHFVDCIVSGEPPLTSGEEALNVIRALECAQLSLKQGGASVRL